MVPPTEHRDISSESLFSVEIPPEPRNPDQTVRAIAYNRKASLLEVEALLEEPRSVRLVIRPMGNVYGVYVDNSCRLEIFGDDAGECKTLFGEYQMFMKHLPSLSTNLTELMNVFLWKLKGFAGGSGTGDKRVRAVDFASQFSEAANQFCYDALASMIDAAESKAREDQAVGNKLNDISQLGHALSKNKGRWLMKEWLTLMENTKILTVSATDPSVPSQQAPPTAQWGEIQ